MRSPRDLAVGCNCRVWSGIRRLTALAALPKRVLGGREFPLCGDSLHCSPGAALGPIPRASVRSPASLEITVPPRSVRWSTDTTGQGLLLRLRGLGTDRVAAGHRVSGRETRPEPQRTITSRSLYSTQLTRRASRLSSLLVAPASQLPRVPALIKAQG